MIVILIICYALLYLNLAGVNSRSRCEALIETHCWFYAAIAISTQILSFLNLLHDSAVRNLWVSFICVLLLALFIRRGHWAPPPKYRKEDNGSEKYLILGSIGFLALLTFLSGLLYPPNNWDSLTYHMARVMHWIANRNIQFYDTAITRQNYEMPLAEYAILHLQLLAGSDRYAFLVQWTSYLLLIIFGIQLTRQLGGMKFAQRVTAITIATLPMAVAQSSTTQNDLLVSTFILAFAFFLLRFRQHFNLHSLVLAGVAMGLALLTKGTAFIYCAAIGTCLALPFLAGRKVVRNSLFPRFAGLIFIVIIGILFILPQLIQTHYFYGASIRNEYAQYFNSSLSLMNCCSNLIRNAAVHLGICKPLNHMIHHALEFLLRNQINSRSTTWAGTYFYIPDSIDENSAGNPLQTILSVASGFAIVLSWRKWRSSGMISYAIAVLTAAILFCLMLKWQPWGSRLHAPLFAYAAPMTALVLERASRKKWIAYSLCFTLFCYAIPFALNSSSRSLISFKWLNQPRLELYFRSAKEYEFFNRVVRFCNCSSDNVIGLRLAGNDPEYAFYALAAQRFVSLQFHSITLADQRTSPDQMPKTIIAAHDKAYPLPAQYQKTYSAGELAVYTRKPSEVNHEAY